MRSKLPAAVYALGMTSLLNDAAGEMIYPLLPVFMTTVLGVGAGTLGVVEGAAEAVASLLRLVAGHLSDRSRRRKPFVVAGYGIASAARPLLAFASSAAGVLAIRLIDRFGKGLRSSPRDALIADVVNEGERGRAFGTHEAMDHAGAVIGPLLAAGLLAVGFSLPKVFFAALVPGAVACLVVVALVREPARPAVAATAATPHPPNAGDRAQPPRVLSRPFRAYLAAVTVFALGSSSDTFLLLRAHDAGLPLASAPLLWALHNGAKSVVTAFGGPLADRIGRRRALGLGWLVYAAVYAGFAFTSSAAGITALFLAYALHFGLVGGAQKALVADLVPREARARGFGYYHLCVGLALLPASALFGVLYQRVSPRAAFLTGAGFALAGAALLALTRSTRGAESATTAGSPTAG